MSTLESRAAAFAARVHVDQLRKYTGAPYVTHPCAVAEIVRSVPHTEEMLAAAWLHDVAEDCAVSEADLVAVFGPTVAQLVRELTDVSRGSDGNRAARKAVDRAHSAQASVAAKTIKLADLIDNSQSILERDPKFAVTYLEEKRLLLEVLRDGDAILWAIAAAIADGVHQ